MILFICGLDFKMPKKPAKKSHDVKIEPEDEPEDEQALRAQCASGEASTSGRNDSEILGKRPQLGNSAWGFPAFVSGCDLEVWHGPRPRLG